MLTPDAFRAAKRKIGLTPFVEVYLDGMVISLACPDSHDAKVDALVAAFNALAARPAEGVDMRASKEPSTARPCPECGDTMSIEKDGGCLPGYCSRLYKQ